MIKKINIVIADDHPIIRQGIKWALEQNSEFKIIGEAKNGSSALELLQNSKPDIITLDVEMPELSGFEVARKASEEKIQTKIIFLTMYKDEQMFNEAIELGAKGYILKENAVDDIVECVKKVSEGYNFISPALSHFLLKKRNEMKNFKKDNPTISCLTKTERKILKLISLEKTTKEISEELFISYKTVENHRNNISKKLKLSGSHSLIKFAISNKSLL